MHGFAKQIIAITALILLSGLLLFACSDSLTVAEELIMNNDHEQIDLNSEEEDMVEIQDNQNGPMQDQPMPTQGSEGNSVSEDSKADQSSSNNSAPEQSPPLQVIELILNIEEVSRESFLSQHGKQALLRDPLSANATRIGKIEINKNILNEQSVGEGDQLKLLVFDDLEYTVAVKKVESGQAVSVYGTTTDASCSPFYLSIFNKTVSATLELPAYNMVYLIKYNPTISGYYLFQTPLQNLDVLEGAPPLIPSGPDN